MSDPNPSPERVLSLQRDVLEAVARGEPIDQCIDKLCVLVEATSPETVCSVMRADAETGRVLSVNGPSVPAELLSLPLGMHKDELVGTCGEVLRTGEPAIAEDTFVDPRWEPLRAFAHEQGIRSCWSVPISSRARRTQGSFALMRRKVGVPTKAELDLLATASDLAGIAFDRDEADVRLDDQRALMESLLEGTEDPVFVKDCTGRYLMANSAEARGVRPSPEEMIGLTDADLYGETLGARLRSTDYEVLRTGRDQLQELQFDNPLQGSRTFQIRKSPLRNASGETCGIIGIARDVTESKRSEAALRQAQKLESLGVLAGGIAHDFNNLLAGILGNSAVLLRELEGDARLRDIVSEILRSARSASDLTNQMLAYAGHKQSKRRVLNLPGLVDDVRGLIAHSVSKNSEVVLEVADELPTVEADPAQLRQVVMNLVLNASEALEGRAGRILVTMACVTRDELPAHAVRRDDLADGPYVRLGVHDDGLGMDEETLARIFDPFFTTKFAGRGLGLAAVQGIVRTHGGVVDIESRKGHGTTFFIYLPASTEREEAAPKPSPVTLECLAGTVLVIDDERAVRFLAETILEDEDLGFHGASDGVEGAAWFAEHADDVSAVLLDLTMPRLGAPETLEVLRTRRPDVPIVLSSGYGEEAALQQFPDGAVDAFLRKPFLPEELVEALRAAVATRRAKS